MRELLCLLLVVTCAVADENENRRSKLPFVADALGNTLPPPSNVPATVGSPVNLLTPDRYEFYTFDESGELVKRLMTLEEIQAIVAAGEETEGLVTFANDNQPTIAFNFSQPPYTKVHNVVTNVQNVLKAQMEAHKNKPPTNPTLDTPDVSDSWSLILPSIFGNTGVDIVPDKSSTVFTTPETETIDDEHVDEDNSLSKEGPNQILSGSTLTANDDFKHIPITEKLSTQSHRTEASIPSSSTTTTTTTTTTYKPISSTTKATTTPKPTTISPKSTTVSFRSTTTTSKATTTTTSPKPTTTTPKPTTTTPKLTTTTPKLTTTTKTIPTTSKPITTTPKLTTITTTSKPIKKISTSIKPNSTATKFTATTTKPRLTTKVTTNVRNTASTTSKPITSTTKIVTSTKYVEKNTQKPTTARTTTVKQEIPTSQKIITTSNKNKNETQPSTSTRKTPIQYEKISAIIPSTTPRIVKETSKAPSTKAKPQAISASTSRPTTIKPLYATTKILPVITTYKPPISTLNYISSTLEDEEKVNVTTLTTQSVSPSTTVSSTEFLTEQSLESDKILPEKLDSNYNNSDLPMFDVAQSISQIATDLGNYRPIPTSNTIVDTTKVNAIDLESKENVEMDIPADVDKEKNKSELETNGDNFIKISTILPHSQNNANSADKQSELNKSETTKKPENIISTTVSPLDSYLSESMDDLLSQVVNPAPDSVDNSNKNALDNNIGTTDKISVTTVHEVKTNQHFTSEKTTEVTTVKIPEYSDFNNGSATNKEVLPNEATNKLSNEKHIILDEKQEDKSYVQISNSAGPNDTNINSDIASSTSSSIFSTSTLKTIINTETSNKNKNNENETASPPIKIVVTSDNTIPTKEYNINSVQASINKLSTSENNKLDYKNDKKKPELFPKIDDFKKKIQKVNIDDKELASERNNSWKLISTMSSENVNNISKDKVKPENHNSDENKDIVLEFSKENQGLEVTTKDLGEDIAQFTELCNELAFRYWNAIIQDIDKRRSFVLSPYSITSMLAMMFMGARGATSGEMNEILKLDDMVTFNPHFTLKNISDSVETSPDSGVIVSAFIRELYSDRNKGKVLTFYKERAQHFYNGHVEEINFKLISDIIRRRTNLLVKRYTWGRILEYIKANTIVMQPPLAAFSANIFQTDCTGSSVEGRDGEMYFVVSPNVRQRRLVPVPSVVYRSGFLAGYDPVLDATAAALGNTNTIVSTLFLMPGQQGNVVHAEDLEELERRILDSNPTTPAWNRLLRTLLPRVGLELQIPRFSHKSIFNVSATLKTMGLKELFDSDNADLGGLNGPSKDLYLSDMIQSTTFVTCGEGVIGEQHHIEEYPESLLPIAKRRRSSRWTSDWDEPRDYQRAFHDPHDVGEAMHLPLHLRPRQARVPARAAQPARLKFDRPFLYFVRHNPSGMILYVGRFNPRLLP